MALAPDAGSAQAGRGLANPRKWVSMGKTEQALWGLCQGSGKSPYQVRVDLTEPAFKCSCPSRKFPCKHGLGLSLMLCTHESAFTEKKVPDWVTEWLDQESLLVLLQQCRHRWSVDFSRIVLDALRRGLRKAPLEWQARPLVKNLAVSMNPALTTEAGEGWPKEAKHWEMAEQTINEFLVLLQFRHEVYRAFGG